MAEETKICINVDKLAGCRGVAERAAGELAGTLPPSELRTAMVGVLGKVAEVFDRLMVYAREEGVGELDAGELPDLGELLDDGVEEEGRQFAPVKVAFESDDVGALPDDDRFLHPEAVDAAEADQGEPTPEPTVADLKARAKDLGLTGVSKLAKDDLAAAVAAAEADQGE